MAWQAIAMAAAGLGREIAEMGMANRQNKKQQRMQKELMRYGQKLGLQTWEKTGAVGQRQQLEKAGLNAALMYQGAGSAGGTTNTPSASLPQQQSEVPDLGAPAMMAIDASLKQSQIENINADTKNKNIDADLKEGANKDKTLNETENIKTQTSNAKIQGRILAIDEAIKKATNEDVINTLKAGKEKLEAEAESAQVQARVNRETEEEQIKQRGTGATTEQNVRIAAQRSGIKVNDAQIKKISADITKSWSDIDKAWADNKIDKAEVAIKKEQVLINKAQQEFNTSTAAQIKQWTAIMTDVAESIKALKPK